LPLILTIAVRAPELIPGRSILYSLLLALLTVPALLTATKLRPFTVIVETEQRHEVLPSYLPRIHRTGTLVALHEPALASASPRLVMRSPDLSPASNASRGMDTGAIIANVLLTRRLTTTGHSVTGNGTVRLYAGFLSGSSVRHQRQQRRQQQACPWRDG
jgi:hypothetical protein